MPKRSYSSYAATTRRPQIGPLMKGGAFYRRDTRKRVRSAPVLAGELKNFDTTLSFTFDTTGEVPATGQLNLIPQGTSATTRIGRQCVVRSIAGQFLIRFTPGVATSSSSTVYLFLVQDTQANGAAAAVTDVMTSNNFAIAIRNLDNAQRFKMLKRWMIPLNALIATSNINIAQNFYLKCNIPLEFSSTAGAITELRSNNLFLMAGTDGQTDDLPVLDGTIRLRFSDR